MTRHETIHRRGKRPIPVEIRRKRLAEVELCRRRLAANDAARDHLREIGVAAVAHALGLNDVGMGGVMTGERMRGLMAPRRQPKALPCQSTSVGCQPREATKPENQGVLSTGALAADISRNIFPDRQRQFGPDLIGGVL